MIPDQFLQVAHAYRLLSELDHTQLKKLLPIAEEMRFPAGNFLFREGGRSAYLHIIVSGDVALEMISDGDPIRVQTLHAGDAMGWSALTEVGRAHFQAQAISPVSTVSFASSKLREACDRDPQMGYALMKGLLELVTERLDATRLQLIDMYGTPEPTPRG